MLSYLSKIQYLITSPHNFFSFVKKEKGFYYPFRFYTITIFLSSFLYAIYPNSLFRELLNEFVPMSFSSYWIILFIISFVSGFITAALLHVISKILGGRGKYEDTYKIYAYCVSILSLNVFFQFLYLFPIFQAMMSLLLIVWFFLVLIKGLRVVHW